MNRARASDRRATISRPLLTSSFHSSGRSLRSSNSRRPVAIECIGARELVVALAKRGDQIGEGLQRSDDPLAEGEGEPQPGADHR